MQNLIKKSSLWMLLVVFNCPVWDVHPGFSVWAHFFFSLKDKETQIEEFGFLQEGDAQIETLNVFV